MDYYECPRFALPSRISHIAYCNLFSLSLIIPEAVHAAFPYPSSPFVVFCDCFITIKHAYRRKNVEQSVCVCVCVCVSFNKEAQTNQS